jgi:hypothetical protein
MSGITSRTMVDRKDIMPKKVYVLSTVGCEYNDEIYEIATDGAEVNKKAHTSLEAAKEAAKAQLKVELSHFGLSDFDYEGEWIDVISQVWPALKEAQDEAKLNDHTYGWLYTGSDSPWTFGNFIKYCEENNIDWYPHVPHLVNLTEVTI